MYLAGVEMSVDLDDDLVIFVRRLLPGNHHLRCCQVLQLVHLDTFTSVRRWEGGAGLCRTRITYGFASLSDDSSRSGCSHLDVSLQLDLLLWPEEVLFLQFAVDSALGLSSNKDVRKRNVIKLNLPSCWTVP